MFIDSTIPVFSTVIFELEQPDCEDGSFKPDYRRPAWVTPDGRPHGAVRLPGPPMESLNSEKLTGRPWSAATNRSAR
jgi:hypothetical protein